MKVAMENNSRTSSIYLLSYQQKLTPQLGKYPLQFQMVFIITYHDVIVNSYKFGSKDMYIESLEFRSIIHSI